MIRLNLPEYEYKLKRTGKAISIWDGIRKRYVALTPEEWVRQHFIAYLIQHLGYPQGRIGNEISLSLNGRPRRCDTLVYDAAGEPLMLIEYKAPHIAISQAVFNQIVRYNICFQVRYIVVSNGMSHYCCRVDYTTNDCAFMTEIPAYDSIAGGRSDGI